MLQSAFQLVSRKNKPSKATVPNVGKWVKYPNKTMI